MEKSELLAKFIQIFPCFADQIQYAEKNVSTYLFSDSLTIHLKSGDSMLFIVFKDHWSLRSFSTAKNDILGYNEDGSVSGLTE